MRVRVRVSEVGGAHEARGVEQHLVRVRVRARVRVTVRVRVRVRRRAARSRA
jgi:hypothetical protein